MPKEIRLSPSFVPRKPFRVCEFTDQARWLTLALEADVISAFSTVPSEVPFKVFGARKRRTRRRPSLIYCGDAAQDAKEIAATSIRDVGFEPVDAGPLRIARYLEPFALAMAQLAYDGDNGPEVAYRIEHFKSRA